jgi:hypothetical protein
MKNRHKEFSFTRKVRLHSCMEPSSAVMLFFRCVRIVQNGATLKHIMAVLFILSTIIVTIANE